MRWIQLCVSRLCQRPLNSYPSWLPNVQHSCPYKQHLAQRQSPHLLALEEQIHTLATACSTSACTHVCITLYCSFTPLSACVMICSAPVPLCCPQVCHQCSSLLREAESASHDCTLQQQQLAALRRAVNPYAAESSRLSQIQAESQKALKDMGVEKSQLQQKVSPQANCSRLCGYNLSCPQTTLCNALQVMMIVT